MFGSGGPVKDDDTAVEPARADEPLAAPSTADASDKRTGASSSPPGRASTDDTHSGNEKKRRSSGVSRAKDMFSSARHSLHIGHSPTAPPAEKSSPSPLAKLGKTDPALNVPQGSLNNSAGESLPGPRSTFRVGVTEDKNKKCRRTMEDTHAYLYNFLSTPAPALGSAAASTRRSSVSETASAASDPPPPPPAPVAETDNGYFAIFDGHAGTFAADWCGKKLHVLLEETIRKNPNTPVPELLDQTFTSVDQQLEKLPLKNSGCTAVIAVLRWEDRVPSAQSATGSAFIAPAAAAVAKAAADATPPPASTSTGDTPTPRPAGESTHPAAPAADAPPPAAASTVAEHTLRETATRQRVLYTANVGDARVVLCRNGRALRLSYDHKGSDENEGRRVANAGGLILNNRVNGVLAVTRALGDAYMKDLVTGHPYTTETVIQPDQDEFLILACDGLWDVCSDQEAVDLVRGTADPQAASKQLVDHALARFSTDNLSCMLVRFDNKALKQRRAESRVGVDGDHPPSGDAPRHVSEADALVDQARRSLSEGGGSGGAPVTGSEGAVGSGDGLEKVTEEMSVVAEDAHEEGQEPGPELNVEALKARQQQAQASTGGPK